MAKRLTDTEIWEEDWFIDLPNDYKLFYLYIKDKCDHSGIWRPNKRKFSMVLNGKMIHFDEFLSAVNKIDENTGKEKTRIIVLENGKWFLTKFVSFQCGTSFQIKNGAHRGALELLVANGIHPSKVPNFDWRGIETLSNEELAKLVQGRGLYRASLLDGWSIAARIEREREIELERENLGGGKGGVGEKPNFGLQHLYDSEFSRFDTSSDGPIEVRGIRQEDFDLWKKFVDYIAGEPKFQDMFKAIFVHPADLKLLVEKKGFTEDIWEPVISKMLSTGIQPQQNLYFRIQDYIKFWQSEGRQNGSSGGSNFDTTKKTGYGNMERW